jgi:hypothetical protein
MRHIKRLQLSIMMLICCAWASSAAATSVDWDISSIKRLAISITLDDHTTRGADVSRQQISSKVREYFSRVSEAGIRPDGFPLDVLFVDPHYARVDRDDGYLRIRCVIDEVPAGRLNDVHINAALSCGLIFGYIAPEEDNFVHYRNNPVGMHTAAVLLTSGHGNDVSGQLDEFLSTLLMPLNVLTHR